MWNIWVEGDLAGNHKPKKLNEAPVQASTLGEAVAKFATTHPEPQLFVRADFGWTYNGRMIFDSESTAQVSQKATQQFRDKYI